MDRVGGLLVDYLQVALPHIAANKLQLLCAILTQKSEEPKQSFGGPVWSDPEKSLTTFVDLINKSLVFMTSVPLNFIDPNGLNATSFQLIIFAHYSRGA